MFRFGFCFPKAAEAVNSKMTDWRSSKLIGYQMRLFMLNNCAVLITKHLSKTLQNRVSIFFYFDWLSFYRSVKLDYRKISVTCCVKGHHEENNEIRWHGFVPHLSVNVLTKFHEKTVKSEYPINSFKEKRFSQKTNASFCLLKIYKHITPSQRNVSTWKAASQWNNGTPSVHSMQTWASWESDSVTVTFQAHTL